MRYLSDRENVSTGFAIGEFEKWSSQVTAALDNNKTVSLQPFGELKKNGLGDIEFIPAELFPLFEKINAERVVHRDRHAVLVGDKESTNDEMTRFLDTTVIAKKESWKFWAMVLFGIALIVLLFYFIFNGFEKNGIGNSSKIDLKSTPVLHKTVTQ